MNLARRVPLFVRIGLAWWLVLYAYPPTRELALFGRFLSFGTPTSLLPPWIRIGYSLAYALVAGWLVLAGLRRRQTGRSKESMLGWGAAIAWFAVSSWYMALAVLGVMAGERFQVGEFVHIVLAAPIVLPILAFTTPELMPATWILFPLGIATVLYARRVHVRAGQPDVGRKSDDVPAP